MVKIILASASPRRQELLQQIGLKFEVMPSAVEEKIENNAPPEEIVQQLSFVKAKDIAKNVEQSCIVIGADTIVVYKNNILGKPKNYDDAYSMLKMLSGDAHNVLTGFTVIRTDDGKTITNYAQTSVKFREITEEEIIGYINTQEPMDKAGAYGIQGIGSLLVEQIKGDYFNVVGLPIAKLMQVLKKEFGIKIL
ncbi:MAG: nucleoside triphosphate pyrophosphatase [Clostridiales bacterium]|jgi:septum formation protein|nr:nucleoside triphosphate pyrophosphatase [Clostridiales bacterium]MDK2932965.1 nucleoside triphosphate pyrophosphatase [Clostridiales bacterium]